MAQNYLANFITVDSISRVTVPEAVVTAYTEIVTYTKSKLLETHLENLSDTTTTSTSILRPRHIPIDNIYVSNYASLYGIIDTLLESNIDELSDENSDTYKLFTILSEVNTYEAFTIFYLFFASIDQDLFTISDVLIYFEDNSYEINYENILIFLSILTDYKKSIIKDRLINGVYIENGNLISFFNTLYNDADNTIFYRITESDMLLKNENYFSLNPKINYFGGDDYYRNRRIAEEDYWDVVTAYIGLATYNFDNILLQDIVKITTDKIYNKKTSGVPVFLKKEYQKNLYIETQSLNDTILALLKDSYASLSNTDVLYFIDKMADEFVEYYDTNPSFDYSDDSLELPDINAFLIYKLGLFAIDHATIDTITLAELKELTFYTLGIFEFNNFINPTYTTLRTTLLAEYAALRVILINIWTELKNNIKYD